MESEHIREVLATTNLAPQLSTYAKVQDFLENDMGIHNKPSDYEILAAFAILSEIQKIKTVDNSQEVSTGIHLQAVLKHMGSHSKEILLNEVVRQCQKWRAAPSWLKAKIDSLSIAYRIYKKYTTLFNSLSKNYCHFDQQNQYHLMSIFWVLYLLVKNSGEGDSLEATRILEGLFKFVFGEVVAQLSQTVIYKYFKDYFKISQPLQPQTFQIYKQQLQQKLAQIQLQQRNKQLDLMQLVTNQHFAVRFLDDMSNYYEKLKTRLPPYYIDQLSFIGLEKKLPPIPVFNKMVRCLSQSPVIAQKISFDSIIQDQDEDQNKRIDNSTDCKPSSIKLKIFPKDMNIQPQDTLKGGLAKQEIRQSTKQLFSFKRSLVSPCRQLSEKMYQTPVSARNQNLSWLNKIIKTNQNQNLQQLKTIYQLYSSNSYEAYQSQAYQKILATIDSFTPACSDYAKRQHSIYSFFAFWVKKIFNSHQQTQRRSIFGNDIYFNAILCLATNLFNYTFQSLQSPHQSYCQIFQIGIVQGQIPINWLGQQPQMPKNIACYLYGLQKRILVQQIWQQGVGYKVITDTNIYQSQTLLKQIKKHTDQRTQELCQAMKIEYKQTCKIVNLIRFILEKRQSLLKDHNIDQIIVCGITCILSINRAQVMSLGQTFQHYNKLLFSLNISRSIFYDRQGQQIDIVSYYNHIFLPQVDEIIYNQDESVNILNTPIRLDIKHRLEIGGELPLASLKFKQFSGASLGKKMVKTEAEEKYRNRYIQVYLRIVSNVRNLDINQTDEENVEDDVGTSSLAGQASKRRFGLGQRK